MRNELLLPSVGYRTHSRVWGVPSVVNRRSVVCSYLVVQLDGHRDQVACSYRGRHQVGYKVQVV